MDTDIILEKIEDSANSLNEDQMPNNLKAILHNYKDRHIYEEFAAFFYKKNVLHPISERILQTLKEFWFKAKELKQYQFNEEGELVEFSQE
jgi:hypothetical protein